MRNTPKLFHCKNVNSFLIKNLAHIANGIGQTLQVFNPVFCNTASRIYFLFHRLRNLIKPNITLGYFIISMQSFDTPCIALMGAQ
jgi:hypothetical protein